MCELPLLLKLLFLKLLLQNVKSVFDAAIKVVLQPPKQKKKKGKTQKACSILWSTADLKMSVLIQSSCVARISFAFLWLRGSRRSSISSENTLIYLWSFRWLGFCVSQWSLTLESHYSVGHYCFVSSLFWFALCIERPEDPFRKTNLLHLSPSCFRPCYFYVSI